jgi:hypothetical protein
VKPAKAAPKGKQAVAKEAAKPAAKAVAPPPAPAAAPAPAAKAAPEPKLSKKAEKKLKAAQAAAAAAAAPKAAPAPAPAAPTPAAAVAAAPAAAGPASKKRKAEGAPEGAGAGGLKALEPKKPAVIQYENGLQVHDVTVGLGSAAVSGRKVRSPSSPPPTRAQKHEGVHVRTHTYPRSVVALPNCVLPPLHPPRGAIPDAAAGQGELRGPAGQWSYLRPVPGAL